MDVHVPRAITTGLRLRGINVLTAQEDQAEELPDAEILNRAGVLNRVLFTSDSDFLRLAADQGKLKFPSIIFIHQLNLSVGKCIRDLELLAHSELQNVNTVAFLPLKIFSK
ncbi:MAG: DUF5615 family PIN-like protein [Limisphaerales bacterium]